MTFWERTWNERGDEIRRAFGDTWPPGIVHAFSWDNIRCPGACAMTLPPIEQSRDPLRHRRDHWLYLTLGLSQPLDEQEFLQGRAAGKAFSRFGVEFAFLTESQATWPIDALYYFMTYMTEGEFIAWGDRFPMQFMNRDGEVVVTTGVPSTLASCEGKIRAALFWPYLFPDGELVTSTGRFMVLVATGITESEWQLAKQTTTAHLLLLLCRAGIGQRTIVDRDCLLTQQRWRDEWTAIQRMSPEQCESEINAGIGACTVDL